MNSVTAGSKKRSKYSVRLGVAANLIAAYVELDEDMKVFFERFLSSHLYNQDWMEMRSYLSSSLLSLTDSGDSIRPFSTDERPRMYVFETWFDWAQVIKGTALSYFERCEAVRAMLGALIRQKDRRRLGDLELREAAKGTLGWTRWDAKHLAELRRNGFSTTAEFEAWQEKEIVRALEGGKRSRPETQPV